MKLRYLILVLSCFTSCKEKPKDDDKIKAESINEARADIGFPKSHTDTLSLISFITNYDKNFSHVDYEKKLDSLYVVIDEELNIIGFEDHYNNDTRKALIQFKKSVIVDIIASEAMRDASYGINYRSQKLSPYAIRSIQQMIYKRRYEELLFYNYSLRANLTRSGESPELYRKRLKDVMPKKVLDSMYPKKIK